MRSLPFFAGLYGWLVIVLLVTRYGSLEGEFWWWMDIDGRIVGIDMDVVEGVFRG